MTINIRNFLGSVAVAIGVLSVSAVPASALPTFTSGSFAFAAFTTTTTDVTTTTSFALSPAFQLNGSPAGDFTLVSLPVTFPLPSPVNFLVPADFNFSDAALGSFVATGSSLIASGGGVNAFATWDITGTFTTGTDWDNAGAAFTANETWSLTQTGGPGEAISMSGTFHSPARPPEIPEPATLTLLGLGLVAAGVARRRKAKSA